ncbi:hypothetical protein PssiTeo3_11350 [Pseudomonas sichuanensis]|nr:hypothetical protein [Pseudomonas sichuanensis]
MELKTPDITATEGGHKSFAVLALKQHITWVFTFHAIGVHKVEAPWRITVRQERIWTKLSDFAPAHVRHFQPRIGYSKAPSLGIDPTEPGLLPLFAATTKQLHAKTNPHQRNLTFEDRLLKRRNPPPSTQVAHTMIKSSDSGQDELAGTSHLLRRIDDLGLATNVLDHVDN